MQRYDIQTGCECGRPDAGFERDSDDGDWVRHADAEAELSALRAVEVASVRAVELLQETRFMAIGSGPIEEWAKTPEGKNHALVWEALQALRAALKE